jgi:hypothetical protein
MSMKPAKTRPTGEKQRRQINTTGHKSLSTRNGWLKVYSTSMSKRPAKTRPTGEKQRRQPTTIGPHPNQQATDGVKVYSTVPPWAWDRRRPGQQARNSGGRPSDPHSDRWSSSPYGSGSSFIIYRINFYKLDTGIRFTQKNKFYLVKLYKKGIKI